MNVKMGIIKVEINLPEAIKTVEEFRKNRAKAFESIISEIRQAVEGAIGAILQTEMTLFLGKSD